MLDLRFMHWSAYALVVSGFHQILGLESMLNWSKLISEHWVGRAETDFQNDGACSYFWIACSPQKLNVDICHVYLAGVGLALFNAETDGSRISCSCKSSLPGVRLGCLELLSSGESLPRVRWYMLKIVYTSYTRSGKIYQDVYPVLICKWQISTQISDAMLASHAFCSIPTKWQR